MAMPRIDAAAADAKLLNVSGLIRQILTLASKTHDIDLIDALGDELVGVDATVKAGKIAVPPRTDFSAEIRTVNDIEQRLRTLPVWNATRRALLAALLQRLLQAPVSDEAIRYVLNTMGDIADFAAPHALHTPLSNLKTAITARFSAAATPVPAGTITAASDALGNYLTTNPLAGNAAEEKAIDLRVLLSKSPYHINLRAAIPVLLDQANTDEARRLVAELLSPGGLAQQHPAYGPLLILQAEFQQDVLDRNNIQAATREFNQAFEEQILAGLRNTIIKQPAVKVSELLPVLTPLIDKTFEQGGLSNPHPLRASLSNLKAAIERLPAEQAVDLNSADAQLVLERLQPRLDDVRRKHLAILHQCLSLLMQGRNPQVTAANAALVSPYLDALLAAGSLTPTHPLVRPLKALQDAINYDDDVAATSAASALLAIAKPALLLQPLNHDDVVALTKDLVNALYARPRNEAGIKEIVPLLLGPGGMPEDEPYLRTKLIALQTALFSDAMAAEAREKAFTDVIAALKHMEKIRLNAHDRIDSFVAVTTYYHDQLDIDLNSKSADQTLSKLAKDCESWKRGLQLLLDYSDTSATMPPETVEGINARKVKARECVQRIENIQRELKRPRPPEPAHIVSFSHEAHVFNGAEAVKDSRAKVDELLGLPPAAGAPAAPAAPAGVIRAGQDHAVTDPFEVRVNGISITTSDGKTKKLVSRQLCKDGVPTSELYFSDPTYTGSRTYGFFYSLPDDHLLAWARAEVRNFIHNISSGDKKLGLDIRGNMSKDHTEALMLICLHEGIRFYNKTGHSISISQRQLNNLDGRLKKIDDKLRGDVGNVSGFSFLSRDSVKKLEEDTKEPLPVAHTVTVRA